MSSGSWGASASARPTIVRASCEAAHPAIGPADIAPDILVARVELGGLELVADRLVQFSLASLDQADRLQDHAVVRRLLPGLGKMSQRVVVFPETVIEIHPHRGMTAAMLRIEPERVFRRHPHLFALGVGPFPLHKAQALGKGQFRPGGRVFGIERDRLSAVFDQLVWSSRDWESRSARARR